MSLRVSRAAAVVLLFLHVVPGQLHAAAPEAQPFDQGTQAFRTGDYEGALRSFLDARAMGLDTGSLRYNVGVTYYRLGRYAEAEQEFQALTRDRQWAPLAHYNLGLTAQRMGRRREAMGHFEQARRATSDPNLRTLAASAIERLGGLPLQRTSVVAALALGYDSNVILSSDAGALGVTDQSDQFAEALASASYPVSGDGESAWRVYGGFVIRKYRELKEFDPTDLQVGLSRDTDSGSSQTSAGAYFDATYVGGQLFERAAVLDAQARGRLQGGAELRGRYQLGKIDGGTTFEYLDGWQQRISGEAGFALARVLVRLGVQIELNDRRDFEQGGEFASYSPTRGLVFGWLILPDVAGWRADLLGEYRASRYNDPHRLNGGTLEVRREEDRTMAAFRVSRPLGSLWRAFVDYSYTRNESTLDIYDYRRSQWLAGVEAALDK
jgi:tetratricopeptide (TPR) repeat protein